MKKLFLIILTSIFIFLVKPIYSQTIIELNTELMKSTFKIKGLDGSYGTAFILGKPVQNDPRKAKYVLITANHVLRGMKGDTAIIFLRKPQNNGTYKKFEYKFRIRKSGHPLWVSHDSADVSALYISLPKDISINLLSVGILGFDDIYKKIDIHPGDLFMCLGYPLGAESNESGFPILRRGILSSFPILPTKSVRSFLLDVKIFKGNSGGPVYFVQSGRTYRGSLHAETTQFIAGLISKEKVKQIYVKTDYKESLESQQLGLAIVIPSIFIKETIDKLP